MFFVLVFPLLVMYFSHAAVGVPAAFANTSSRDRSRGRVGQPARCSDTRYAAQHPYPPCHSSEGNGYNSCAWPLHRRGGCRYGQLPRVRV